MSETVIKCPACHTPFELTELMAAPLLEISRKDFEQRLAKQEASVAKKESEFAEREAALAKAAATLDSQVAEKLVAECERITADERKKAQTQSAAELEKRAAELTELKTVLQDKDSKLAEAQKAQLEFMRKERELDDAKRELDLTVEKRVTESVGAIREQASKEVEERLKLQMAEKDHLMTGLQKKIEELSRKLEQGSQQLQGEVLELELESLLKSNFPFDSIDPVPKGEFGGDVLHRITTTGSDECGVILWESKRTKNWSDLWIGKLKEDQRAARADIAIIVSQVLPKGIESFEFREGVWITHPRMLVPLGAILRNSLVEIAKARAAGIGQQTKAEEVYQYVNGPHFRQRIEAIADAFDNMREDLAAERKTIQARWAKREKQIDRVMRATVGMYGDLQGIAGKSMQTIAGLELEALDAPEEYDSIESNDVNGAENSSE